MIWACMSDYLGTKTNSIKVLEVLNCVLPATCKRRLMNNSLVWNAQHPVQEPCQKERHGMVCKRAAHDGKTWKCFVTSLKFFKSPLLFIQVDWQLAREVVLVRSAAYQCSAVSWSDQILTFVFLEFHLLFCVKFSLVSDSDSSWEL